MIRFILVLALALLTSSAWGQTVTFPDSGTVINHLAKLTGPTPSATNLSTTDITAIGIASTFPDPITRQVAITTSGIAFCAFDGAVTVDDYFGASATNAGQCADVGASPTAQTLGQILGTGPANTYRVILSASVVSGLSGATKGEPLVGTAAGSAASSAAYIDATQFSGADMCVQIDAAFTAARAISASGGTVDARGFSGTQTVSNSCFTNYPLDMSFNGVLLTGPVVVLTSVAQVIPPLLRWDGNSSRSGVPSIFNAKQTGTVIQAANGFSAWPLVSYALASGGISHGQMLVNLGVNCLSPNNTFSASSIGIQNWHGQEGSGGDTITISDCHVGLDIGDGAVDGAGGALGTSPWNKVQVVYSINANSATTLCLRYGTTVAGYVGHTTISDFECDTDAAAVQPSVGLAIDGSALLLTSYRCEGTLICVQLGQTHGAHNVTLLNGDLAAVGGSPATSVIDIPAQSADGISILGVTCVSNTTNLVNDHNQLPLTCANENNTLANYFMTGNNGTRFYTTASSVPNLPNTIIQGWCAGGGISGAATLDVLAPGNDSSGTTCSTVNGQGIPAPFKGTIKYLNVVVSAAGFSASDGLVEIYIDGAASGVKCTIGTGTTCSDITHSAAITAGAKYTFKITTVASSAMGQITASALLQ